MGIRVSYCPICSLVAPLQLNPVPSRRGDCQCPLPLNFRLSENVYSRKICLKMQTWGSKFPILEEFRGKIEILSPHMCRCLSGNCNFLLPPQLLEPARRRWPITQCTNSTEIPIDDRRRVLQHASTRSTRTAQTFTKMSALLHSVKT